MPTFDDPRHRPEFEARDLDSTLAEADAQIRATIKGLQRSETDDTITYRTVDGMLVAIIKRPAEPDQVETTLAYRTEPASELATRKASKIATALQPHGADS
jgi:hypothetical protein